MEQVKNRLGHVKDDAAKLLQPLPKGPLVPGAAEYIPRPKAPAQLPTADEIHLSKQAQRVQEVQRRDEEVHQNMDKLKDGTKPPTERAKNLWGVVRGFTSKALTSAAVGASRVIYDTSSNFDQSSFRDAFGALTGPESQYLNSFDCTVVHAGRGVKCTVHVSSTHLCLDGNGVKDVLPLTDVASLIPSVCLPTAGEPFFFPVPDPRVKPTALQVFTRNGTVVQLSQVTYLFRHVATHASGNAFNLMYAEIDRAWRLLVEVPLPDVQYI